MSATLFQPYSTEELSELLSVARKAVTDYLANHYTDLDPSLYSFHLQQPAACFVTLEVNGELQGCLGSVEPRLPLLDEVYNKARAASFQDPRFPPLKSEQLDKLTLEVSVLNQPHELKVLSEQELASYLMKNRVGLILSDQSHHALFLPQVWEQVYNPRDFIRHLKRKAGWKSSYWSASIRIQTFEVTSQKEAFYIRV
ncbi:AmmeMemoRadiSam system protein A [Vibrio sp. HA2012]|uniref:AmmeMemoRadiSam system protein A n=1 Tax=Vibrio sp. HA2012 TaxID=1971595 RepID=UPI000C2BCD9A|nr:AmmeMemoRadiSam system protein A [Vibrio sp. HA2012]PJC87897.1 AmmeMemoRadiSam system protein A [Vibrio sp. HA2012]